jgi:hypothetical protein
MKPFYQFKRELIKEEGIKYVMSMLYQITLESVIWIYHGRKEDEV